MDILTKRTVFDKIPERLSGIAKEYNLDEIALVEKGAVIPEKELEIDEQERTVVKYISTVSVDRDGDIILPDGILMDDFRKNPVILYAHKHGSDIFGGGSDTLPIGKDVWIKADKFGIKAKQKYANHQLANDVFNMHKDGFALASSIGFIPLEFKENDGGSEWKELAKYVKDKYGLKPKEINSARGVYTKIYLLEHSDVPVPSNPDALALAYAEGNFKCKSIDLINDLELEEMKTIKELEEKVEELEKSLKTLEKEKSELEHSLSEKTAEIEQMKPKFTKEKALEMISRSNDAILEHIDRKLGKV